MAYQKMLVSINVYEDFSHIINSAIAFAHKNKAKVDVITFIDNAAEFVPSAIDFQKALEENAKEKLSAIKDKFKNLEASFTILEGNPNREIPIYAEEKGHDLIIIGSHGKHGLNLLLGSTANAVLNRAKCDVLTVRIDDQAPEAARNYGNILMATDLEPDAVSVVKKAKEIAKNYGAKLSVATVHGDPTVLAGIYGIVPDSQARVDESIEAKLNDWVREQQLDAKTYSLIGNTAEEIISLAANKSTDLIIIGSHQRGAIGRFFLGSTANAVLQASKDDVLVVKI